MREKNGIPDGVRRGLSRLERERPGLVVTTAGVAAEAEAAAWLTTAVRVVLLLLTLDVRARLAIEDVLSLRNVLRILDVVDSRSESPRDEPDESPTMSFVDAASRRG